MSGVPSLTDQQVHFFQTFGFLHLPKWFGDEDFARIERGFADVFANNETTPLDPSNEVHNARDPEFSDNVRQMIYPFIDRSEDLVWLRDDIRIRDIVTTLLGDDTEELPSDGNVLNCDVSYHSDAFGSGLTYTNIKIFFYLDALDEETGALRMMPGTNHVPGDYGRAVRTATIRPEKTLELLGIADDQLPAHTLDVEPGDIIVGDFRTVHGSFKGAPGRRLFTLNYRVRPPAGTD